MTMMSPEKKATELINLNQSKHPPQHSKNTKKNLFLIYCINVRGLTSHEQYKTKNRSVKQILDQNEIQNTKLRETTLEASIKNDENFLDLSLRNQLNSNQVGENCWNGDRARAV